ncbi:hypothetical protein [Streptomyces mirabilis]|uniref:hypothetical protein n=1 Tax=Streptomyces mirabilis TaxID=68239 RepID=UPI0033B792AA
MTGRAGKFVALTWDDAGLSDLHAQLAREMPGRVTAFAIEQEVRLVRGVVNAPDRRGVGRVVLWDGQQLDSSVAFDLPLTDAYGANIPPGDLAAALRDVLADCPEREVGEESRDAFGIPVIDASAAVHDFVGRPRFHLSDALQAAAAAFPSETMKALLSLASQERTPYFRSSWKRGSWSACERTPMIPTVVRSTTWRTGLRGAD